MEKILIIDDDEGLVHFLRRFFQRKGYAVTACSGGRQAIEKTAKDSFDLILLDYKMPDLNGLDILAEIRRNEIKTPVIIITAYGTTNLAIEAMKYGAYDYLIKPFERKDLSRIVSEALQVNRQMKEIVRFPAPSSVPSAPEDQNALQMIGNSRKMQEIYKVIGQVAEKDVPVLITGESGTGKELAARAIYHHSRRRETPFIAVNCAAIPESLFESELFGHERGAFTGADRTYIGKFERCHNGTLFLDEIGEMSTSLQAKLLRALQTGEIERLGASRSTRVDVRVIAATNKDIEAEVRAGRFREDLYWRLKVITLDLPPLRQRSEDIPELVNYFLRRFAAEYDRPVCHVSEPALSRLIAYSWPGNVRELENCIRRAVLLSSGDVISEASLMIPESDKEAAAPAAADRTRLIYRLRQTLEEIVPEMLRLSQSDVYADVIGLAEEILVGKALEYCNNNQVKAAALLGISRNTLRDRLGKHPTDSRNSDPETD
ncbi:MAG: sigma-54-dependent transcriptional regulator [Desulfobacterales bacterium]